MLLRLRRALTSRFYWVLGILLVGEPQFLVAGDRNSGGSSYLQNTGTQLKNITQQGLEIAEIILFVMAGGMLFVAFGLFRKGEFGKAILVLGGSILLALTAGDFFQFLWNQFSSINNQLNVTQ